jgi:monoamine oxidase
MSTIIVGAGAAGITAAYTLLQAGYSDFTILEASSTYLGRIKKNANFTNFPIDMGAEWIHVDPSIFTTIVNDKNVVLDVKTTPYKPKYFEWDGEKMYEETLTANDHKFVNYTWYDFFNNYLVPDVINKIEFNCTVTKVEWENSSTTVRCNNGKTFNGTKTIITVPIKILQDNEIVFVPDLPLEFRTAVNVPVMATGMKVFLAFKKKFYPDAFSIDADFVGITLDKSERFFYDETYGQSTNDYVLGMYVLGDVADRFVSFSDSDVILKALADLDKVFGNNVSTTNYIKGVVQNWVNEPHIRGSYSIYGNKYAAIDILRKPLSNTLYFAGEAIPIVESDYENGFAHGAALSGRYAALTTLNASMSRPRRRFWQRLLTCITTILNLITSFFS